MTPFFLFTNEVRPRVTAQNPDKKLGDVAKIIGQQYKMLSQAQLETYKANFKALQDQYKKEIEQLKSTQEGQELIAQAKNKRKEASLAAAKRDLAKAIKSLDRPKRPLSGYMVFLQDLTKSQNISSLKEAQTYMKAIAGKWKGMSEAEKAKGHPPPTEPKGGGSPLHQPWLRAPSALC